MSAGKVRSIAKCGAPESSFTWVGSNLTNKHKTWLERPAREKHLAYFPHFKVTMEKVTQAHRRTDAQTHRRTDAQTHRCTDAHTQTHTHRHTRTHTDTHTDTYTHRHIHTHTHTYIYIYNISYTRY